jgi:hypothetical protein
LGEVKSTIPPRFGRSLLASSTIAGSGFIRATIEFHMRSMISAIALASVAMAAAGLAQAQSPAQPVRVAYAVEPFTSPGQITIQGAGVRLRAEPFATKDTPVLSTGSTGLALNVVGIARLPDWNWYQVILKSGQKAFIRSDYTSAPSKGAALAAPLPAASQISHSPASAPAGSTPPTSDPGFSAASPPALTTSDSAPLSAPVFAPATPAAPLSPTTRPNVPPVSSAASAPANSAAPLAPDAPISLTPRSSLPPGNSSGLESKPPGQ